MSGKPKKHHHEEHEEHVNHEAWVIPYADMLTLLMAMFLVLWAIGQVDVSKAKSVSTGFSDEFGLSTSPGAGAGGVGVLDGVERQDIVEATQKPKIDRNQPIATKGDKTKGSASGSSTDSGDKIGNDGSEHSGGTGSSEGSDDPTKSESAAEAQLGEVEQALDGAAAEVGADLSVTTRQESRGLVVSLVAEGVVFEPGSATLTPTGRAILDSLADKIAQIPNNVAVEGHTDSVPISSAQFPSNRALSAARAATVADYLANVHGVDNKRLSAVGYGDTRPIADNATAGGRAKNRRVELAIANLYQQTQSEKSGSTAEVTTTTTTTPTTQPVDGVTGVDFADKPPTSSPSSSSTSGDHHG